MMDMLTRANTKALDSLRSSFLLSGLRLNALSTIPPNHIPQKAANTVRDITGTKKYSRYKRPPSKPLVDNNKPTVSEPRTTANIASTTEYSARRMFTQ